MISTVYTVILSVLIVWLSFHVINLRRTHKVSIGDGKKPDLKAAIAAQLNAVEFIPISLLLLYGFEINSGNILVVHFFGIVLIIGRVIHARAMLTDNLNLRVRGMQITFFTIIGLAIANMTVFPYTQLLG